MAGLGFLLQPPQASAQRHTRVRYERRHAGVVVTLPRDRARVLVGGREYFYSGGVFYKSAARGFEVVKAPVGARIQALPAGAVEVHVGIGPLFVYYGNYYRFDPAAKEYVIVNPPQEAPPPPTTDRITMVDGQTVSGTFMGGTQSTVQVDVGGKIQEIPIDQIISIDFAPPAQ